MLYHARHACITTGVLDNVMWLCFLLSYSCALKLHFINDVLGKLNILNMSLQEENSSPLEILDRLKSVVTNLTATYLSDTIHWGVSMQKIISAIKNDQAPYIQGDLDSAITSVTCLVKQLVCLLLIALLYMIIQNVGYCCCE